MQTSIQFTHTHGYIQSKEGEVYTSLFSFEFSTMSALGVFTLSEKSAYREKGCYIQKVQTYNLIGARYYDPELGLWGAYDPLAQFFNPYGYGGDPINGYDPDGLWKIGLGISIGYTRKGGFSIGVGVGVEDVDLGFVEVDTYAGVDRDNNGVTASAQVGGGVDVGIVSLGGGVGGSYNNRSGYSLDYRGNAGAFGVGVGAGGANYWATDGSYLGGTFYTESYTGAFGVRAYAGHEWGYGGQEGRGLYAGTTALGAHAEYSQNFGFNYGARGDMNIYSYDSESGHDYVGKEFIQDVSNQVFAENSLVCAGVCTGVIATAPIWGPRAMQYARAAIIVGGRYINSYSKGGKQNIRSSNPEITGLSNQELDVRIRQERDPRKKRELQREKKRRRRSNKFDGK
jgi:RHS repeat-associated protein